MRERRSGRDPASRPARSTPRAYQRHALHAEDRVWVEKNCYVDIWIELIHALGLDPLAMLPFTVAIDFEGDQWTFFKPPHDELRELYGVDVQELNVLAAAARARARAPRRGQADRDRGRRVLAARHRRHRLPPPAHQDHHRARRPRRRARAGSATSTTPATTRSRARTSCRLFRVGAAPDPTFMPLFAELVRIDRRSQRPHAELRAMSRRAARAGTWRAGPATTRWRGSAERFAARPAATPGEGLAFYHAWAFATVRQLGAASELAALHLRWLGDAGAGRRPPTAFEHDLQRGQGVHPQGRARGQRQAPFDADADVRRDGGGLADAAWTSLDATR